MAAYSTGETGGQASSGLPQLDFDTFPSQIFWLAVCLAVLYFLMTRIALPRIASVLEERADVIADDLEAAEDFRKKAQAAEATYERALADARARAQDIAAQARAGIQEDLDAAIAEADAKIAASTAESETRIAGIRDSARDAVEAVANDAALAVVEALLPGAAGAKAVKAAVGSRLN